MKTLDRRRRVAVIAGGMSAIAGGLSAFIGRHGATLAQSPSYFLIGVSVGVTVGAVVILITKMKAARDG